MADFAILFDSSKCTACRGCQVACKTWNNLPSPIEKNAGEFTGSLQNPPDLNSQTRLIISFSEKKSETQRYKVDWAFGRRSCMHCYNPACVAVCPSDCLRVDDETGFVVFQSELCTGCQYCNSACPYDVPRYKGKDVTGANIIMDKCDACLSRLRNGRTPACVHTCQPEALKYGPRDEMVAYANKRVEELKAKGYDKARTYGIDELDGAHVIHVLKYGIDQYMLPEDPKVSPLVESMDFMKPLTAVGAAALVAGLGLSFLTGVGYKRDRMYYDEQKHDVMDADTDELIKHIDKEAGER